MKAIVVVIDSFGIGALPDAESYGDAGSDTAGHTCEAVGGARWPVLRRLGLGNAAGLLHHRLAGIPATSRALGSWGVMAEAAPGKDTVTGHWELAGLPLERPLHQFPQRGPAFPAELLEDFGQEFDCAVLGNEAASGTEIIARLGAEHERTGSPIVYTSADSVFQIAAHEAVISLERLYAMCAWVREKLDEYPVGRVIARPFEGPKGAYQRTRNRRDYALAVPGPTLLDALAEQGVHTIGVGKIGNIFDNRGIAENHPDKGNLACLERMIEITRHRRWSSFFMFVNLVDTDSLFGHRRDPRGYHDAVAVIDSALDELISLLGPEDLLIVTADHGCDPTHRGTDHTREYVPLLAYRRDAPAGSLGLRDSFADVAQSVAEHLMIPPLAHGTSFLPALSNLSR